MSTVAQPPGGVSASSLRGVRALVVDDDADSRDVVAEVLRDAGMIVDSASTVAEAFDALSANRPDVIVSDIGMPFENGYSFLRNLRQVLMEEGSSIPALALTGFSRPEDRERAFAAGFSAHLAKPIDAAEVLRTVGELVRKGP